MNWAGIRLRGLTQMEAKQILIKLFLTGIFGIFTSSALHAEHDLSKLKNLFTDKAQRSQIDAARSGRTSGPELKQTSQINVSGYVTRSDGKSVVWLNNTNTLESTKVGDIRVHQNTIGKDKKVTISVDGKTARLKPGESWSKETGQTTDNY